jgi:hypothetical protein
MVAALHWGMLHYMAMYWCLLGLGMMPDSFFAADEAAMHCFCGCNRPSQLLTAPLPVPDYWWLRKPRRKCIVLSWGLNYGWVVCRVVLDGVPYIYRLLRQDVFSYMNSRRDLLTQQLL